MSKDGNSVDDDSDGGVGGNKVYKSKTKLVLVSFSKLYSKLESISVSVSRFSSSSISYYLLLGQLGGRAKHFKSPGNPKSIV